MYRYASKTNTTLQLYIFLQWYNKLSPKLALLVLELVVLSHHRSSIIDLPLREVLSCNHCVHLEVFGNVLGGEGTDFLWNIHPQAEPEKYIKNFNGTLSMTLTNKTMMHNVNMLRLLMKTPGSPPIEWYSRRTHKTTWPSLGVRRRKQLVSGSWPAVPRVPVAGCTWGSRQGNPLPIIFYPALSKIWKTSFQTDLKKKTGSLHLSHEGPTLYPWLWRCFCVFCHYIFCRKFFVGLR